MNRFGIIVADCPWQPADQLRMSKVKRGAASQYATMPTRDLVALGPEIRRIAAPDAVLALWFLSSMLSDAQEVMDAWGFRQTQIYDWIKMNNSLVGLRCGMGRIFRNASEHALIGKRGKVSPALKNVRNVDLLPPPPGHSVKPDALQNKLSSMYPRTNKLELFARRKLAGWTCTGLECPGTRGRKIDAWLKAQQR